MPKRKQTTSSLPPIPTESNAWLSFLVPLVLGLGVGLSRSGLNNSTNPGTLILLLWLTGLGWFLMRHPFVTLLKSSDKDVQSDSVYWSGIYGSIGLVGGAALVFTTQLWGLAILGVGGGVLLGLYLWLATQRKETSVLGEWTSIAGFALNAPGAYLAITRSPDMTALNLFALNLLFFGGTLYYMKYKVREQSRVTTATSSWHERLLAARAPILYSIVACFSVGWIPGLALGAVWLPIPKVFIGALERPIHVNAGRLGIVEVIHSIVFMILVLWAWRY